MNINRAALAFGLTLLSIPIAAQGESQPYEPGITRDAVSYWLPQTRITVTVNVSKMTYTPGEFSRYAERYLRIDNINSTAQERWSITGVSIQTEGVPDKERLYTLSFPEKGERPYIELTADGIIKSVNVQNDTPVTQTAATPSTPTIKEKPKNLNPYDYLTEEILMAASTAKMAELTAKEIYSIRESRNAITRGQAEFIPTDGESLKYILESLSEQEAALLTLFSGTNQTEEHTFTINVTPKAALNRQILFRFSTKLGLLSSDNLAGEPVWMDITETKMTLGYNTSAGVKEEAKNKKSKNSTDFLYYRIPGRGTVKVYDNRTSYLEQEIVIAQFGTTEVVSSTIMGKHADTKIRFNTSTGNVTGINE